jgi:hypothetical protein
MIILIILKGFINKIAYTKKYSLTILYFLYVKVLLSVGFKGLFIN